MIYFEADDGRICLVYDYLGRALVGSTDIPADDPDAVRCDDAEIDYFLDSLRALLPGLALRPRPDRLRLQRHPPAARLGRLDPGPDQPRPLGPGRRARRRPAVPDRLASSAASGPPSAASPRRSPTPSSPASAAAAPSRPATCRSAAAGTSPRRRERARWLADAARDDRPARGRASTRCSSRYGTTALRDRRPRGRWPTRTACRTPPTTASPRSTGSRAASASCISPTSSCAARRSPSPAR